MYSKRNICSRGKAALGGGRMDLYTVSFFGHRILRDFGAAEKRVEPLIRQWLLEKEYVEFLVGRDGDSDQIVSSAVRRMKRAVRDDNSALIWVLPYETAELRACEEDFRQYYDGIEVCENAAESYPKRAFQVRNRQMIDRSDAVVCYVDHPGGGAWQALRYAQKQRKPVINLAETSLPGLL